MVWFEAKLKFESNDLFTKNKGSFNFTDILDCQNNQLTLPPILKSKLKCYHLLIILLPFYSNSNFGGLGPQAQFFDLDDDLMETDGFGPFLGPRSNTNGAGTGSNPFRSHSFTPGSTNVNRTKSGLSCVKRMKITKKILNPDGKSSRKEDKVLTINVKPGWKAGTKITFQREGDQNPNRIPADIVFIIRDKPDSLFKREGVDVKYIAKITLREALCGCMVKAPTITGGRVHLKLTDIVKPNTIKKIPNQGLPHPKDTDKRGDLVIVFDIQFPDSLTEDTKQILWDCLP
uniref:Chaperone DnaJ C-terminal domain-containing protein n=1 Tax=Tetranychus urticae TaxID=32264 RepID=T1L504_TETUR